MPDIVLTTINAKYIHTAFGLRYLKANLGELATQAEILEFTHDQRVVDIAESILSRSPKIVGVGVYIWNAEAARELVAVLKRVRPELCVVLGGPEVSHEIEAQEIAALADFVIVGEGEVAFRDLCRRKLEAAPELPPDRPKTVHLPHFAAPSSTTHRAPFDAAKIIQGNTPELSSLCLPYHLYDDIDLERRVIYVEASRGCPFRCEFCLSALDKSVRPFPLDRFLNELDVLWRRGARHFKFVDRTFNLRSDWSVQIVEFFRQRYEAGTFVHFEMIPDRLPDALKHVIAAFPAKALQFEVGIQTFDPAVAERISRKQDYVRIAENLRFLREQTGVHVHADLIIGLPGESVESFAQGFDRLVALGPHEIQLGVLKRLRGAPIARHEREWGLVYSDRPPYEILQTCTIDFANMQRLKRFSRGWELVVNRGNFGETSKLLYARAGESAFARASAWSEWLNAQAGRTHSIELHRLATLLVRYLREVLGIDEDTVTQAMTRDYARTGRELPPYVLGAAHDPKARLSSNRPRARLAQTQAPPARQQRHLGS